MNRRTSVDFYSVYDKDTFVCVDAKEQLCIAKKCYSEKCNIEGKPAFFYKEAKDMVEYLELPSKLTDYTVPDLREYLIKAIKPDGQ